jgi:hypothetical protein
MAHQQDHQLDLLQVGWAGLAGSQAASPSWTRALDPTVCSHAAVPAAGIRLAGATNDVHVFDVRTGTWSKITPQGEPPSPRAAHAAAAVGAMVVVQVCRPAQHPAF